MTGSKHPYMKVFRKVFETNTSVQCTPPGSGKDIHKDKYDSSKMNIIKASGEVVTTEYNEKIVEHIVLRKNGNGDLIL